jgi:beta propeller repeat protein
MLAVTVVALAGALLLAAPGAAGSFTTAETPLVVSPASQFDPAISGKYVSFTDNSGGGEEIWLADTSDGSLHQVVQAIANVVEYASSDISFPWIVFVRVDDSFGGSDIDLYNILTGLTSPITSDPAAQAEPAVSSQLVAWEDFGGPDPDIQVRDLAANTTQVITGGGEQSQPAASGSRVVYLDGPVGTGGAIRLWDAATGLTTTVTSGPAASPDIDGDHVTFADMSGADPDVAVRDVSSGQTYTLQRPGSQVNSKISGDFVAFEDSSSGVSHVCLWHWTSGDVLCPATPTSSEQAGPDLSGNTLVYDDLRNGNSDLFRTTFNFSSGPVLSAQVQQPINPDGSSVFNAKRGVVPVKFALSADGMATCDLPSATISLSRTSGAVTGVIDESVYSMAADTGSSFRIDICQYVYNLSASALGPGSYRVNILIDGSVVGSATFQLR